MYIPYAMTNYTPVLTPKPVPNIGDITEGEQVCVSFSKTLVPHLLGLLETYKWLDKWQGTEEDQKRGVQLAEQLQQAIMLGECNQNMSLTETNSILKDIYLLLKRGASLRFDLPLPVPDNLIVNQCYPDHFDSDGDDDATALALRRKVLCFVTQCYIQTILGKMVEALGVPVAFLEQIYALAGYPPQLQKVKIEWADGVLSAAAIMQHLATAGVDVDALTCIMSNAMKDDILAYAAFRDSLPPVTGANLLFPLSVMVDQANHIKDNFGAFIDALVYTFDNTDLSEFTCPCGSTTDCNDPLSLVGYPPSLVITPLGNDLYRFENDVPSQVDQGRYVCAFRDEFYRDLNIEATESDTQAVFYWELSRHADVGDCGGANETGFGGFTPLFGQGATHAWQVGFQTSSPLNSVYKITCCTPTP